MNTLNVMTQRLLIRTLFILFGVWATTVTTVADTLPNMIFIMTDDQGWGDVSYNGHPKIKTPNLDAMAASGIRFDRFYATASVCSPTRASCLTGRNNWRMNISNPMRADEGHLPQEEITIAEALKAKGYATGHFGKWHVGGFDAETAGSHVMPPWEAGFDECFSTHNVIVTHDPYAKLGKGGIKACYWHNGRNIPLDEGQNDPSLRGDDAAIVMTKAVDFIREQAAAEKPFLALVWFHNVHTPLGKNTELMKQYADCDPKEQVYFSNITAVDTQVGVLRAELRELGVADSTMVWFTSDNGPNLKGKKDVKLAAAQGGKFAYTPLGSSGAFRGWKRDCYEGGLRMPGILEWPAGITRPFATEFAAVTSDYFPTALDAAGIPLPTDRQYDGISLLPLIEGLETERKSPIGFHCNGMQAWTENRYKIVRTIKAKKKSSAQWELYDLIADPFEENSLAPKHPEIVQRMSGDFAKWAESAQADQQKVIAQHYLLGSTPLRKRDVESNNSPRRLRADANP
ncbi:sulfatase family protein [Novipirellula artificiosorum]|uniref:Arylsulfatase n=1 Tax=Novipirellula artificiosorum TaxID=2528016 RepID=A0A5C6D973_9BACT|nr:sulfatase-like hydrolase/transferase [Novipirellula artificiosorum]TWU32334.1 Arylsulfatase [Novipirellula artificiosorum]